MDPTRIFYVLSRGKLLIVAITAIAVITGAILSIFIIPPVYEATAVLMVGKVYVGSYGSAMLRDDIQLANSLMHSYQRLVHSSSVAQKAVQLGKLNMSPGELAAMISTNVPVDSQIIELTARANHPVKAANFANAVAKAFTVRVEELMGVKNVTIVDAAAPPAAPVKPNTRENILRAGFTGLLTALIIVFSLDAQRRQNKGTEG